MHVDNLIRAAFEDPDNHNNHLVLADAIEDAGSPELANFIRQAIKHHVSQKKHTEPAVRTTKMVFRHNWTPMAFRVLDLTRPDGSTYKTPNNRSFPFGLSNRRIAPLVTRGVIAGLSPRFKRGPRVPGAPADRVFPRRAEGAASVRVPYVVLVHPEDRVEQRIAAEQPGFDPLNPPGHRIIMYHTGYRPVAEAEHTATAISNEAEEVTKMSRLNRFAAATAKRYASQPHKVKAKDIVSENPGGTKWMEVKGKGRDASWQFSNVNKGMFPPLSGSRLAIVLHEIRDKFGAQDLHLKELAEQALAGAGNIGVKGDVYTQIRDRLQEHAAGNRGPMYQGQRGPNTAHAERAGEIARSYNWHRVGAGLSVDQAVAEFINKVAKDHLKAKNEHLRAAHNVFGLGSKSRNKATPESRRQFMNLLRKHVKSQAVGPNSVYGLDPAHVTDEMLLRSIRRLAQNEEHIHGVLGFGGLRQASKDSTVTEVKPDRPAWYPVGGKGPRANNVGHVNPAARASQFKRFMEVRRYGLFGPKPKPVNEVKGIRHRSQPGGKPDDAGLLNTYAEHAGIRHALIAMGAIPPKTANESRPDYDRNVQKLVNLFAAHARKHVTENPDDELSRVYLEGAKRLHAPNEEELEYGPGRRVQRVNLDPMAMSITGLSTAAYPLLKKIAGQLGVPVREPVTRPSQHLTPAPPVPNHPDYGGEPTLDLLDPATGADYESSAASYLKALDEYHQNTADRLINRPQFGSGGEIYPVSDTGAHEGDFDGLGVIPQEVKLPGKSPDVLSVERTRTGPKLDHPAIRQSIADHLAGGGNYDSTIGMLKEKHGLNTRQASAQLNNYNKLKAKPKPAAVAPKPTGRLKPAGSRMRTTKRVFARGDDTGPTRPAKPQPPYEVVEDGDDTDRFTANIKAPREFAYSGRLDKAMPRHQVMQHAARLAQPHAEAFGKHAGVSDPGQNHQALAGHVYKALQMHANRKDPQAQTVYRFNIDHPEGKRTGRIVVKGQSANPRDYAVAPTKKLARGDTNPGHGLKKPTGKTYKTPVTTAQPQSDRALAAITRGASRDQYEVNPNAGITREQAIKQAQRATRLYNIHLSAGNKLDDMGHGEARTRAWREAQKHADLRNQLREDWGLDYHEVYPDDFSEESLAPDIQKAMAEHTNAVNPKGWGSVGVDTPGGMNFPRDDQDEPIQHSAYRAPAGGMVVRGTAYKSGAMVPDMKGAFMNPPSRMSRLAAARKMARGDTNPGHGLKKPEGRTYKTVPTNASPISDRALRAMSPKLPAPSVPPTVIKINGLYYAGDDREPSSNKAHAVRHKTPALAQDAIHHITRTWSGVKRNSIELENA